MTVLDHIQGAFGLSCGFWLIFSLYCIFSIKKFLVKRYEQETDLLNTVYFKEHVTFSRYLHDFHSSAVYACHLLMCAWGWRFYSKRKSFRDIDNPEFVTRHFTPNEISRVKRTMISVGIVVLHGVIYFALRAIQPELLD